jgi:2-dehydro-3-deoxygalactonokinase
MSWLSEHFISCDWGTTNFRLRLVETNSLKVIQEHQTGQGVRFVYQQFMGQNSCSQTEFFGEYLKQQIGTLPTEHRQHLVVISGMASANIGLMELEYADMPFDQTGKDLVWSRTVLENDLETLLISGVKCPTGMMRGEEVQAIGLGSWLSNFTDGILILPGTHSKHISYSNGTFLNLKTFMTGELFEIISDHSILANSVVPGDWNKEREQSFKEGVLLGARGKMTENLFSIRARHIIEKCLKEDNYYFLSGMLIGDELSYLGNARDFVFLAATGRLATLYQLAINEIAGEQRLVCFNDDILEQAGLLGQKKILLLNEG